MATYAKGNRPQAIPRLRILLSSPVLAQVRDGWPKIGGEYPKGARQNRDKAQVDIGQPLACQHV